MRALVAGGAGFIGSHLVERLLGLGWNVVVVDNLVTGRIDNLKDSLENKNCSFVEHDVTQSLSRKDALQQRFDFVLNLASPASPSDFTTLALEILRVGSMGTENLLKIAVEDNAAFLLASTSEVYGDPLVHPQPETYYGNVSSIGPRSCYDESKRFAEALTVAYQRQFNIPIRIARIFNTYGPRMRPDDGRVVSTFVTQALQQEPLTVFGDGCQTRSFCYVDDLVLGLMSLMESDYQLPVNIGNPHEFTMIDLAKLVIRLTGSGSQISLREIPFEREGDPLQRKPDIAIATRLLNWQPVVELEEGLSAMISYFQRREVQ